jgi:2-polyprenyl-3-methyl-5-hydroxy-6-metoxy-1,4-benzoquinol methylase
MYAGLVDLAFGVAPGQWTLVRCGACCSAWLDPRPNRASIGLAYSGYYTHRPTGEQDGGPLSRLRRTVAVEYANRRIGTRFAGGFRGAHWLAYAFPRLRSYLDVRYRRHLTPLGENRGRLLDVGCGNGEFLSCAEALGWQAEGIDVDPAAVAAAQSAGCSARVATLDDDSLEACSYQHVNLSHVIEHVHDPLETLRRCRELLVPSGRLWLHTPNVDSRGHAIFGAAWRGLEPPRHLVLFSRAALADLLRRAGFAAVEFKRYPAVPLFIWEESRAILRSVQAERPGGFRAVLAQSLPAAIIADYSSIFWPATEEFLTCVAFRPR